MDIATIVLTMILLKDSRQHKINGHLKIVCRFGKVRGCTGQIFSFPLILLKSERSSVHIISMIFDFVADFGSIESENL